MKLTEEELQDTVCVPRKLLVELDIHQRMIRSTGAQWLACGIVKPLLNVAAMVSSKLTDNRDMGWYPVTEGETTRILYWTGSDWSQTLPAMNTTKWYPVDDAVIGNRIKMKGE